MSLDRLPHPRFLARRAARALACLGCAASLWTTGAQAQNGTAFAVPPPPPNFTQLPEEAPLPVKSASAAKAQSPAKAGNKPGNQSSVSQAGPGEPVIQRNVIEDEGSRIEETRVRGQVKRITVTPKVGGNQVSYEILPGDGSGSESSRSTAGKRVWNVLQF